MWQHAMDAVTRNLLIYGQGNTTQHGCVEFVIRGSGVRIPSPASTYRKNKLILKHSKTEVTRDSTVTIANLRYSLTTNTCFRRYFPANNGKV